MGVKLFSDRKRPVHLGPYPLENLRRRSVMPNLDALKPQPMLTFDRPDEPESIVPAMAPFQAMMDAIRDGIVNPARADIPGDPTERANHLKAFGYFSDASMVGVGALPESAWLTTPRRNPGIDALAKDLRTRQTKTLAAGIDVIMADLKESIEAPARDISGHTTCLVFLYEHHRDPRKAEPGHDWITGAQDHRACLRASETAIVIANYIRLLGFDARAHTATSSDLDLDQLTVAAGLAVPDGGGIAAPWIGSRFGVAAVSTDMELTHDRPLAALADQPATVLNGPGWWFGAGHAKSALNRDPYAARDYALGAHPFETLKRVDTPTTYIDEPRVARVPKRADMFARAQFGDMGKANQDNAKGGHYARKSAPSFAQRRMLGALVLLQDGPVAPRRPLDPVRAAAGVKAASYFLGVDAVGLSRCPDWTWYSHDATGTPIDPPHDQAISMIVDQGFETMEGASGDDWISVAQSMRAYLRFSLLG
ncbi:MAG: NAD-binding oxidoreductase, partial [Pseudomonadota bacterium]